MSTGLLSSSQMYKSMLEIPAWNTGEVLALLPCVSQRNNQRSELSYRSVVHYLGWLIGPMDAFGNHNDSWGLLLSVRWSPLP